MRLVYLDEGGSDYKAPYLCVAGVLVHGDNQWPDIDRRIGALIEKYVPEPDRRGFIFHAKDIYHGAKYFDRRKSEWADEKKRYAILDDLASIIEDLHLPVVVGNYERSAFGGEILANAPVHLKGDVMHCAAALDCLMWADRWLERYFPSELATVVHEDVTSRAKPIIKRAVQVLRNDDLLEAEGMGSAKQTLGLPLKRIIDTVHFAAKSEARPLQLADLCAFIVARKLKDLHVPEKPFEFIFNHLKRRANWKPDP